MASNPLLPVDALELLRYQQLRLLATWAGEAKGVPFTGGSDPIAHIIKTGVSMSELLIHHFDLCEAHDPAALDFKAIISVLRNPDPSILQPPSTVAPAVAAAADDDDDSGSSRSDKETKKKKKKRKKSKTKKKKKQKKPPSPSKKKEKKRKAKDSIAATSPPEKKTKTSKDDDSAAARLKEEQQEEKRREEEAEKKQQEEEEAKRKQQEEEEAAEKKKQQEEEEEAAEKKKQQEEEEEAAEKKREEEASKPMDWGDGGGVEMDDRADSDEEDDEEKERANALAQKKAFMFAKKHKFTKVQRQLFESAYREHTVRGETFRLPRTAGLAPSHIQQWLRFRRPKSPDGGGEKELTTLKTKANTEAEQYPEEEGEDEEEDGKEKKEPRKRKRSSNEPFVVSFNEDGQPLNDDGEVAAMQLSALTGSKALVECIGSHQHMHYPIGLSVLHRGSDYGLRYNLRAVIRKFQDLPLLQIALFVDGCKPQGVTHSTHTPSAAVRDALLLLSDLESEGAVEAAKERGLPTDGFEFFCMQALAAMFQKKRPGVPLSHTLPLPP